MPNHNTSYRGNHAGAPRPASGRDVSGARRAAAAHYAAERVSRERRGHRRGIVVGVVVALVLAVGGTFAWQLYQTATVVRADAREILAQRDTLKTSLKEGDAATLGSTVDLIVERTDDISRRVNSPLWNVATMIPYLGSDFASVRTVGNVAETLVNEALVPVAQSASGMRLSDLVQDKQVNVDMIEALSASLDSAIPVVEEASDTIQGLPEAHIPQVQDYLQRLKEPLASASGLLGQAHDLIRLLPQMLGADGQPRSYLVIAQNNAELRSTGGLPGSWGTINVDDGAISLGDFVTILHEDGLEVEVTDEELDAIHTNLNTDPAQMNFHPDFVRVGQMAREYWAQAGNGEVDGVIALDPVFLQQLLSLTGASATGDYGYTIDGTNAASVLLNEVYKRTDIEQDEVFSSLAASSFDAVMGNLGGVGLKDLFEAVERGGSEYRLFAWMANDEEEALMAGLGLDGALRHDPTTPELGVYANDTTYSKISWYADVRTSVGEGVANDDGTTTYDVTTTVTNTIPVAEAPTLGVYITGVSGWKRSVDDMLNTFLFVAPEGGSISNFQQQEGTGDAEYPPADATLEGLQVVRAYCHTQGGQTTTFTYQVTVSPEATQPLTVRSTALGQSFS